MNETIRNRIFDRLRTALDDEPPFVTPPPENPPSENAAQKVAGFIERMEAVRTELYRVKRDDWLPKLMEIISAKKIGSLIYGPGTCLAAELEGFAHDGASDTVRLRPYDEKAESFKKELFGIDAGITTTRGGIADRGALILCPTPQEPRLISLVPPIHIAVVDADKIYGTFTEAIQDQHWPKKMPTNVLLVSGPSKTADIEFTLIFGVHGPKELVVLLRED